MTGKFIFVLFLGFLLPAYCHAQQENIKKVKGQIVLTENGASQFAKLPLRCAEIEFPYKTGISFADSSFVTAPKNYHPAFFGCFDWHSSVHGHWMLVKLLKKFPGLSESQQIRQLFDKHFSIANIEQELKLFSSKDNSSFERTYGWAWLMQLQNELIKWDDTNAKKWAAALQPLTTALSKLTIAYLGKLVYPIRAGEHSNLAFGLSMMHDYAVDQQDSALSSAIKTAALRFYFRDKNCPFSWEPGGSDFLSPCLEEANLMRKILSKNKFIPWLKNFMPQLFNAKLKLEPGIVKDRTDGKLVHLDGLNFSRAWCLKGIATTINNGHLLQIANEHLEAALPRVVSGEYAGEHWLASFAVYALTVP